jgi:hypothetical protein
MNQIINEYIANGYALVPIPLGEKGPKGKGWNTRENTIRNIEGATQINGNVGLAHLYCSPYVTAALDIDDLSVARVYLSKHGIDLQALLDAQDAVQISSGRLNRAKLLYKLPFESKPMETKQIQDPVSKDMVFELRCASSNGKTVQDLLPPSIHPETGIEYKWAGKGDWRDIPFIPETLLTLWEELLNENALQSKNTVSPSILQHLSATQTLSDQDIQHLRSALLHLRADDRKDWIKAGLALKNLGEVGRGLWIEWSMTSKKYDPLDAANTWDTLDPTSIDYRYVFAEAQRQGWVNPTKRTDLDPPTSVSDSSDWPEPQKLPGELRPVIELDPQWLPEALRDGCIDIAERLNCPLAYVAIPALVGAGTVLGNKVGILPKAHDDSWVVHPGVWGGIVGSPGSMKTPALLASLKALQTLEDEAAIQYANEMRQYLIDKAQFDKSMANFKSGKVNTFPIEPTKPVKKRYMVNDVTYQALGEILANNPQGILAYADELSGLLQSLDTPGQEAARGFYLSGWGGQGNYTFDRITRESITLTRYQLAVFGGFQPDRIKAYVRYAQSGSSKNDGLLQRFQLLVWPDLPDDFELIDRPANKAAILRMHNAIVALKNFSEPSLPGLSTANSNGIQLFHFNHDAQEQFNNWYLENEKMLRHGRLDPSEHGHFAKYRSLIPGLALLFHLLDGHTGPICKNCVTQALHFARYLKSHAKRIYSSVHGLDSGPARSLAQKILDKKLQGNFTQRNVQHKGWANLSNKESVTLAVNSLVEHGWLLELLSESGGRKTMLYKINPNITKELL